jgi:hypothetical protein
MNGIIDQQTAGPNWSEQANRIDPIVTHTFVPSVDLSQRTIEDFERQIEGDREDFKTTLNGLKKHYVFTKRTTSRPSSGRIAAWHPFFSKPRPTFRASFPALPLH